MTRLRTKPFRLAEFFALALMLGALALVPSGCSRNTAIVGKWQGTDRSDVMEFLPDGTYKVAGDKSMNGTYSFSGDRLSLKLDGDLGKAIGTVSARVVVEGDTLKLTDPDSGKVDVYKRVK